MLEPVTISLPVADRRRSHDFYREALGLDAIGVPRQDGMPEPLQFALNQGMRLMLVPDDGFGFVVARTPVMGEGAECLFSFALPTRDDVLALRDRWVAAGGGIAGEPSQKDWGFNGVFADPDGHLWMVLAAG